MNASYEQAIKYLKENKKKQDIKEELLSLKIENKKLLKKIKEELLPLKIENKKLREKIKEYKKPKKFLRPSLDYLRKSSSHLKFVCAYCSEEKALGAKTRIISGNRNYTICRACFPTVKNKYDIKLWSITK